jgi:3-oxoacyl-[acyl-carrier protein] reductase|tara:strand:- start:27 stop:758 length:732 start_codon:yes stop_codon:yes gene_type:complete
MNEIKKIFITGASGGIGSAICKKFIDKNFTLVLTASSDEKVEKLKDIYGDNNFYYKINLADSEILDTCLKEVAKNHKDISVIVNNAGVTEDNLIFRMKNEQWNKVIQTNLNSNYQIIKSLLPNMLSKKYGKIIGISSIVGSTGNPGQANYVASKSGMIGLYKSIASEVAKRNINVNIISPGFISTSMTENLSSEQKESYLSRIPMSRFGKPEDIANLVYFLATDDSSYITGQNFHVNGGMLMV